MFILPLDFDGDCELVMTAITQLNITEKDRIIQKIDLKNKRFVENVKKNNEWSDWREQERNRQEGEPCNEFDLEREESL